MERRTARTIPSFDAAELELQRNARHPEDSSVNINDRSVDHDGQYLHAGTHQNEQSALKPADGGRDAWRLLISAFIFEALFWGFPTSYGVFQAYYTSLPQFASDTTNVAVIGTLAQGLAYLGAPFSAFLTKRFPRYQKLQLISGWLLCILGLLTASFATSVPTLIVTQGMAYGMGFIIHTYPILNMVNEWWITRKGMAFGLISAASGLTGIFMPLLLEALLHKHGYQTTLRGCAIAMFILTAPMLPLLRGRIPVPDHHNSDNNNNQPPKTDWTFLRNRLFYFYATAMTIQGFGFFIPPTFLPSYAVSLIHPPQTAASLLAIMSLFQTLGQFVIGYLSDKSKYPVSLLASICSIIAATATFTLWGLGKSFPMLGIYSATYGFFAFGFSTLRVAMGRAVTADTNNQQAVLATYSTFVFVQGIGNVMVGPVAGALMKASSTVDATEYGASRYKELIIFVASSALLAAVFTVLPHVVHAVSSLRR